MESIIVNNSLYKQNQSTDKLSSSYKIYKVRWNLTKWCNYRCEYCLQKHPTEDLNEKFKILKERAGHLRAIIEKYISPRPYTLTLTGGEVTYFNLIELLDSVKTDNLKTVTIITNFSRSNEYFKNLIDWFNSQKINLNIICSLHESQIEFEKFYEKFKDLSSYIYLLGNTDSVFNMKIEFVITPENVATAKKLEENCNRDNIDYFINVARDKKGNLIFDKPDWLKENLNSKISDLNIKQDYYIIDGDKYELTREELLNKFGNPHINNLYCSKSLTCITISDDDIISPNCKNKEIVGNLQKETLCFKPGVCKGRCSLCDNVIINKSYFEILKMYNDNILK